MKIKSLFMTIMLLSLVFCVKAQDYETILVFESGLPYTEQTWFYSGKGNALQQDNIKKHWDEVQSYVINPSDVKSVIDEQWNENMNISYIGGGYRFNEFVDNKINGHEYVDLGLSVKWATCNVGANKPEDYGNYYAWGETSTKSSYTEDNSKTFGKSLVFTEYGKNMNLSLGDNTQYDVACAHWDFPWRLPTDTELVELMNKCTWTWTTQNGVKGYKVTGPNGNSIFLPAAGSREGSSLQGTGEYGCYWSSKPFFYRDDLDEMWLDQTHYAYELYFDDGEVYVNFDDRYYGLSVRPVSE